MLDEENALDRERGVSMDDEGRVLEVRDEKGQDGEELLLRELYKGERRVSSSTLASSS